LLASKNAEMKKRELGMPNYIDKEKASVFLNFAGKSILEFSVVSTELRTSKSINTALASNAAFLMRQLPK